MVNLAWDLGNLSFPKENCFSGEESGRAERAVGDRLSWFRGGIAVTSNLFLLRLNELWGAATLIPLEIFDHYQM